MDGYQGLYDFGRNRSGEVSVPKHRCFRKIRGHISIDRDGKYLYSDIIPEKDVVRILASDVGNFYTGNQAAFAVDKVCTVFGEKKHESYMKLLEDSIPFCEASEAIYKFLKGLEENDPFQAEGSEESGDKEKKKTKAEIFVEENLKGVKKDDFISFRVDGVDIESDPSWGEWFDNFMESKKESSAEECHISLISGNYGPVVTDTFSKVSGGAAGTGVPLYSYRHKKNGGESCAFIKYGQKATACPILKEEDKIIGDTLGYLFNSPHNHSSSFKMFWWDTSGAEDDLISSLGILGGSNEDISTETTEETDQVKNVEETPSETQKVKKKKSPKVVKKREKNFAELINSVYTAGTDIKKKDNVYHICNYNIPEKGRFYLYGDRDILYSDLAKNIQKWYEDCSIKWSKGIKTVTNIYAMLFGLIKNDGASNKFEQVDKEFGNNKDKLAYAVLYGKPIPRDIFEHAKDIIIKQVIRGVYCDGEKASKYKLRLALQTIKAYLIREGITMGTELQKNNTDIAYQCGRWLATMDQLQQKAHLHNSNKKLKKTLAQKFYKGVKSTPGKMLSIISDQKELYLGMVNDGTRVFFERLFAEIAGNIGTRFPVKFSKAEQGSFDLGFAQQHQAFYDKKSENDESNRSDAKSVEETDAISQ